MFGFIRPYKPELRVREVNRFQAVYCGLCHEIKDRYGRLQTYFLSYDMTFFCFGHWFHRRGRTENAILPLRCQPIS